MKEQIAALKQVRGYIRATMQALGEHCSGIDVDNIQLLESTIKELEEKQLELKFLEFFFDQADFGPGDSDVRYQLQGIYETEVGGIVPPAYVMEDR